MLLRSPLLILACVAGNVVACASIVKLDHSDEVGQGELDGEGVEAIPNEGPIRTAENVTIDKPQLKFGFACGGKDSQAFTIKNEGSVPQPFSAVLDEQSGFKILGTASGTVDPGQTATITIEASGPTPGPRSADINVTVGASQLFVGASSEIKGAKLTITPDPADFGEVRKGTDSRPLPVVFKNEGTEATKITGFTGDASAFKDLPPEIVLAPGESKTVDVVMKATPSPVAVAATLAPNATNLCGAAPPTVRLTATVVSTNVTVPASVSFADIGCRTTPTQTKSVRVENFANTPINGYTATLKPNSRFTITSGGAGNVPPGTGGDTNPGHVDIVLVPKPPADAFGDVKDEVLTLTLPGSDRPTATVNLQLRVVGVRIETTVTGETNFDDPESKDLPLTNKGNLPLTMCYGGTISAGRTDAWSYEQIETIGANGGTRNFSVRFDALSGSPAGNNYVARLGPRQCPLLAAVPLCQDALPVFSLRGDNEE